MIRSDVGVALKKYVYEGLSEESSEFLSTFEEKFFSKGDVLFVARGISWDPPWGISPANRLYDELDKLDSGDFLVVAACTEYPSDENDLGSWTDNPWKLHSVTTVEISFNS